MTTVKFTSKAGLRAAATGTLAGIATTWFVMVVLTASAAVAVGVAVLAAAALLGYLAGFRAGGGASGDE